MLKMIELIEEYQKYLYIGFIILLIELYSEFHIKNHGRIRNRLKYLISIKSIFNLFYISSFIFIFYYVIFQDKYNNFLNLSKSIFYNVESVFFIILPTIIYSIFSFIINSKEIVNTLTDKFLYNHKVNNFYCFIKFLIYRIIV